MLKTDYATFFRAALDDVDLIDAASRASSVDVLDEDLSALNAAGFKIDDPRNGPLFRYLARTAGWGPEDVDYIPFLYLGQDRFSQQLGNVHARTLRQALVNNQSAELARLAEEALAGGQVSTESFQELLAAVLRELIPAEQNNGVAALHAAASGNEALRSAEIARVVGAVVSQRPHALTDVGGALAILQNAPSESASSLGLAILNASDETTDGDVWNARERVSAAVGVNQFRDWETRRIDAIGSWGTYASWNHEDLENDIANLLLWKAVQLAASDDDNLAADEDDLASVEDIARRIKERVLPADDAILYEALGQPVESNDCAIAFVAIENLALTQKQLSHLSYISLPKSAEAAEENSEPLARVLSGSAALAIRAAKYASKWGAGDGAKRISSAGRTADVIASWVSSGAFASSLALHVIDAMTQHGAEGQKKLAEATFDSWSEDPEGTDTVGVELVDTAVGLATMMARLESVAQDAIHDKLVSLFGLSASPAAADGLTPSLFASDELEGWADDAIAALVPWFSTNYDFTGGATTAAAHIIATGFVSDSVQKTVLNSLVSVVGYGGAHRQRALASTARLPWAANVMSEVNSNFARYVNGFEPADFGALIDLQLFLVRVQVPQPYGPEICGKADHPVAIIQAGRRQSHFWVTFCPRNSLFGGPAPCHPGLPRVDHAGSVLWGRTLLS